MAATSTSLLSTAVPDRTSVRPRSISTNRQISAPAAPAAATAVTTASQAARRRAGTGLRGCSTGGSGSSFHTTGGNDQRG